MRETREDNKASEAGNVTAECEALFSQEAGYLVTGNWLVILKTLKHIFE